MMYGQSKWGWLLDFVVIAGWIVVLAWLFVRCSA